MTYRRDSNVFNGYGRIIPTSQEALEAFERGQWLSYAEDKTSDVANSSSNRIKDVAWMVSHCDTFSKREVFVRKWKERSQNITIDIMGRCGARPLPPETSSTVGTQ